MPRGKAYRRAEAARFRQQSRRQDATFLPARPAFSAIPGTGWRRKSLQWPLSPRTGKQLKVAIPEKVPDKKLVLFVGASHLRPIVDGFVPMEADGYTFGFLSVPGACADLLTTEVKHVVRTCTQIPDAVCVLAPSNNLNQTPDRAAAAFGRYLRAVLEAWRTAEVFVVDHVPRLSVEGVVQESHRQNFQCIAGQHRMFENINAWV